MRQLTVKCRKHSNLYAGGSIGIAKKCAIELFWVKIIEIISKVVRAAYLGVYYDKSIFFNRITSDRPFCRVCWLIFDQKTRFRQDVRVVAQVSSKFATSFVHVASLA